MIIIKLPRKEKVVMILNMILAGVYSVGFLQALENTEIIHAIIRLVAVFGFMFHVYVFAWDSMGLKRVEWVSKHTGYRGHGQYMPALEAESAADYANKNYGKDIFHIAR